LVAFVGLLWSIPYAFLGKKVARILVFPCAYLLFCIPLTFLDTLTFPLRLIAASTATGIVNGIGIGAVRYGTAILSVPPGSFQLDVADPCSGLRSFLAMVSLTAAYAYFSQKSFVGKWVLFLCSPLIAIASNIVRIVAIAVVAFAVGQETATGFYHDYSPYIVFASAVLFMTGLGSLLNRLSTINSPVDSVTSSDKKHKVDFQIKTGTTIIVLLVSTSLTLHMMGDVKLSSESGVTSSLPAFVGDYTAEGILFCQDLHCGKSIPETMPTENRHCPACGGVVDYVSPIEKNMLPSDTVILRKRYRNSYGKTYAVTIVISGKERTSIHRPQMCLTGQGHQIVRERCVKVPVQEKQIEVMFLDLKRQVSASGSSGGQTASSVYAYWFIGGDRETASHWKRTFLTAYDNIFRGTSPRWAYVAIMTSRTAHPTNDNEQLKYFISELYPGIRDDHSGE
ncbi:MAG: exosortase/archaeosortase family protein, partial [Kiritimatiellae bacterium]|nr:exosortase/archaeosortase family protein [Kiritimatiellia bacterium]